MKTESKKKKKKHLILKIISQIEERKKKRPVYAQVCRDRGKSAGCVVHSTAAELAHVSSLSRSNFFFYVQNSSFLFRSIFTLAFFTQFKHYQVLKEFKEAERDDENKVIWYSYLRVVQ